MQDVNACTPGPGTDEHWLSLALTEQERSRAHARVGASESFRWT